MRHGVILINEQRLKWVFLGLLAVVLALAVSYLGKTAPTARPEASSNPTGPTQAESAMQGFRFAQEEKNASWNLEARSAEIGDGGRTAKLEDVRIVVRNSDGWEVTATGSWGFVALETKDMEISGGVRAVSSDGYTFTTDQLRWSARKQTLTTDEKVVMDGPAVIVRGTGLVVHAATKRVEVLRDVETTFKP